MANVMPGEGEKWGPLKSVNEASMTASQAYGINKTSPNVDIAKDFLQFWTSQKQNQLFNLNADWVPCIVGSTLPKHMAAYAPQIEGYASGSAWLFAWGEADRLSSVFEGKIQAVLSGRGTKEDVIAAMKEVVNDPNYGIEPLLSKKMDDYRNAERNAERGIAAQSLAHLLDPAMAAPRQNYVILVSSQAGLLNGHAPLMSIRRLEEAHHE
jgi:hypothetical protein